LRHAGILGIGDSHCAHPAPLLKRGRNIRVSCQATRGLGETAQARLGVRKGILHHCATSQGAGNEKPSELASLRAPL
jgi:hypothetical protein